jgi:hypothetical protein
MRSATPPLRCLAEWYRPAVTERLVDEIVATLDAATAAVSAEGTPVRLMLTLAVPTDEVVYGLFAAESPDNVVEACRRAGIPIARLSTDVAARIA